MARKIRKQLYIDRTHDERLKMLASRTGRSEADIVREAVEQYRVEAPPKASRDRQAWFEALAFMHSVAKRYGEHRRRVSREQIYEGGLANRGKRAR